MRPRLIATFMCSALSFIAFAGVARSETIGRYECNIVGTPNPEPLGDPAGHGLSGYQFSCFGVDGLLKGAVYSATNITEWNGPQATYLLAGGIHRSVGGFAVTQMLEGTGSAIMKDGKPVGSTGSGKAIFKFASGTLAALSGKTVSFTSKSTGLNRFELDFAD
ncbi:hypothetical protein ACVW1C_000474 [Bradyrhizobium sp. USDA 4011]